MKRYIIFIFLVCLSIIGFAKGGSGIYYITGIAYGNNKTILSNASFTVKIGEEIKQYKTDSKGQFEIEVHWTSACRSNINTQEWEKENRRLNPEFIFIKYNDIEIRLNNEWKKYAKIFPENKNEVTKHSDLLFKK
jgi:hypothetical protein